MGTSISSNTELTLKIIQANEKLIYVTNLIDALRHDVEVINFNLN